MNNYFSPFQRIERTLQDKRHFLRRNPDAFDVLPREDVESHVDEVAGVRRQVDRAALPVAESGPSQQTSELLHAVLRGNLGGAVWG